MIMTPQARRRITSAVQQLSDDARDRWMEWLKRQPVIEASTSVPYEIAEIALQALTATERDIQVRLDQHGLNEDFEADLLNDLGYVRSIAAAIRQENVGH